MSRKSRRNPGFQDFHDRFRCNEFGDGQQRTQHADVENDGLADFVHDGFVHGDLFLAGIGFALGFDISGIGDQKPARPDDGVKLVVGLLGQADQDVGLDHLGEIDGFDRR